MRLFPGMVATLVTIILSTGFARMVWSGDHQNDRYALIDIRDAGPEAVNKVKQINAVNWWIEAGDNLLVYADPGLTEQVSLPIRFLAVQPNPQHLFLVNRAHVGDLGKDVEVLVDAGRKSIVQARTNALPRFAQHKHLDPGVHKAHANLSMFSPNIVLAQSVANMSEATAHVDWHAGIDEMLAAVDMSQWQSDLTKLAAWNRNTHGQEIATAKDWLMAELSSLPNVDVETQIFKVRNTTAYNVIATIRGTSRPDDLYIVGAHYDSTSQSPATSAPGAEDNGSGTAGLLQMARVAAKFPAAATIKFIAFSGEEQGLHGSEAHVAAIVANGESLHFKGMINMDMIGYTKRADNLGVIIESQEHAKPLVQLAAAAAAKFSEAMDVEITYDAWGSDHVPYLQKGLPALLSIDRDWNSYPAYHRTNDTVEKVSAAMAEQILRMNIATLAQLSLE